MIEGGCFCKKTRYTIKDGDYRIVNCHCTMCRRISAAPYVTWVVVPKEALTFAGTPAKELKSSENALRQFCAECGTHLTFRELDRPATIDVTVGSLDKPEDYPPEKAVHVENKLAWLSETEI